MRNLNDMPDITEGDPDPIYALVPERHRDLVRSVWEEDRIPFASMKLENNLSAAVGITFTLAGFRYVRRARRNAVQIVCTRAGDTAAAEIVLQASAHVERALKLMSMPIEVIGFDVGERDVRQIKAYIRTNVCNERFEDKVIACDPSSQEMEQEAVSGVLDLVAPARKESVLKMLRRFQRTKGALEGIAVDLHGGKADVKMYFLPRRQLGTQAVDEPYTDEQTLEFIDTAIEMFGLQSHIARAHAMVPDMRRLGLCCSFLAVEEKPDGSHELKVDFNTNRTGGVFPDRRVAPEAAGAAVRAAYAAAGLEVDEIALNALVTKVSEGGIVLDDFTTDFGKQATSGKVYLRSSADRGYGVFAKA